MTRNEKTNPISIPFDSPRRQLLNPRTAVRWVQCTECIEKTNPIYTHKHPQKHLPTVLKNPVILSEKQTQFDGSPGSDRSNENAKQTQSDGSTPRTTRTSFAKQTQFPPASQQPKTSSFFKKATFPPNQTPSLHPPRFTLHRSPPPLPPDPTPKNHPKI